MATTGIDENKLRHAFLEDADDLVQKLSTSLLLLEKERDNRELVNEVFRLIHSLKSESAVLGYAVFSNLAHKMEDVLGMVRDGSATLDKSRLEAVFAGSDLLAEMLVAVERGAGDAQFDTTTVEKGLGLEAEGAPPAEEPRGVEARAARQPVMLGDLERRRLAEARDRGERLYRLVITVDESEPMKFARAYLAFVNLELASNVVKVVPPMEGETAEDSLYARTEIYLTTHEAESVIRAAAEIDQACAEIERLRIEEYLAPSRRGSGAPSSARQAAGAEPADAPKKPSGEKTTIRVDTKKLDDLWILIAELIQQKAHISRIYDRFARSADPQAVREDLGESFDSLDKISNSMQQVMMETRMIPISIIFNKFPRLVRDLSRKLGKAIELAVSGEETEIDRGIVEALSDPLTHIIRNSIDHGIEFPEERVRLGKPEKGRVRISAYQQGGGIVIELEDDGKGIDLERVRSKALALGVPGAAEMDEGQLVDLIFLPGFSTRDVVTDLSGRGVGMDVVATRIRGDLKGDVTVSTVAGEGTLITLLLPLTFSITNALLVRAENIVYALPLSAVESTLKVLNTEIRGEEGRRTCIWTGEEIPLFYLGGIQGKGLPRAEEYFTVILSYGADRAGLVVDELLEEQELVIKPIDDLLNGEKRFSGISVLEDGTPVFILDTSFVQGGTL